MKLPHMGNRAPDGGREGGQTLALVAVAMVGLLAMAALAIDLTTLYLAHGEIQRAADAAALAGAKAFVDSGVTTNPSNTALQNLARSMAVDFASGVVNRNNVAGAPAHFIKGTPIVNLSFSVPGNPSVAGNPRITVSLQRTGLPLFFARIWGGSIASVSATAIAEAYNPAYSQANTGGFVPPAPKCVKPFLVPNNDKNQRGIPFVDPSTGAINPKAHSFIGETITLTSACVGQSGCNLPGPPNNPTPPGPGQYLPMLLPDTHRYCPSASAPGCPVAGTNFEKSTECCDGTAFDFQQCGVSGTTATWDPTVNPGGPNGAARQGLQCLIHTTTQKPPGKNPEQDTLDVSFANNGLLQIQPGSFSQRRYNVAPGSVISTSDSIITVPLFDVSSWQPATHQVIIVGFLQLFVNYPGPTLGDIAPRGDMNAYILNVSGCGSGLAPGSAVSGGGVSAIPVRLIYN